LIGLEVQHALAEQLVEQPLDQAQALCSGKETVPWSAIIASSPTGRPA